MAFLKTFPKVWSSFSEMEFHYILLGNVAVEYCHFLSEQDGHDLFSQTMTKSIPGAWNPSDFENEIEITSDASKPSSQKRKQFDKSESEAFFQSACLSITNSLSSLSNVSIPPPKKTKTLLDEEERLYDLEMKITSLPEGPTKQYFEKKRDEILFKLQ